MKKLNLIVAIMAAALIFGSNVAQACTNYLVTKKASKDGSTMISYAADSHLLYGELYHWPAGEWPAGTMMDVVEWDTGKWLGQIEQVRETYNVIGNMNEWQLAIGETTYGGRSDLRSKTALIDYGSLIYITLQRAKTAREAIQIMHELVTEYGYYSSGESFSIADPNEVWIMELIGKGEEMATKGRGKKKVSYNKDKGAVWVARRIPDGFVSGHANQARITTFPLADGKTSITSDQFELINNPEVETVYAADVISFAKRKKFYEGPDEKFSFSDVYAPVDFGGARFCEIRVWSMFNEINNDMNKYWDYVKGDIDHPEVHKEGTPLRPENFASNRMPLWVKPNQKIGVEDMFEYMRNHLEDTELDMSKDAGAGAHGVPYRWRPLTWEVEGETYCNERATATQQTAFSFVSQSRSWLPREIGGIIWFGLDDASGSVYTPIYSSSIETPKTYRQGNGSLMEWSDDAAFWVFNQVTNYAYTRWDMIQPEIAEKQTKLEGSFVKKVKKVDEKALALHKEDPAKAVEYLTKFSTSNADHLTMMWKAFYQHLFMKYMDGNVKVKRNVPKGYKYYAPELSQPGYSKEFYKKIVDETGDKLKVTDGGH
jgi:dipeptidase